MSTKSKSKGKTKSSTKSTGTKSKKQRMAEREAKKAARKGDGTFPDRLLVTREKAANGDGKYFWGHKEDGDTLVRNGQTVAIYRLNRVSTIDIKRKVLR